MPAASRRAGRSRSRRREAPAPRRPLRLQGPLVMLAALVGAAFLVLLVVRYSAVNALLQAGPETGAMLWSGHPGVRIGRIEQSVRLGTDVSGAGEALARAPLSEIPLLAAAHEARLKGDAARHARLVETAVRRNPRSRQALLLELDVDLRRGESAQVASGLAVLTRLFSNAGPLLVSQLAAMAEEPATRDAIGRVMAGDPAIREQVLEQLARRGADPDLVLELAGSGTPPAGETPRWQPLLIDSMVRRGDVDRAHQVWRRLAGLDGETGGRGVVHDPEFRGLPGFPPFGWEFASGSEGFAEPRPSGGLAVQYYARDDARLASQLLRLPAGGYRIAFRAEGQAEGEGGGLAWTVSCHPSGRRLATLAIQGVDFAPKSFTGRFVVPAGCRAQWLRLEGSAAEFPEDQQVTISALSIEPEGARR